MSSKWPIDTSSSSNTRSRIIRYFIVITVVVSTAVFAFVISKLVMKPAAEEKTNDTATNETSVSNLVTLDPETIAKVGIKIEHATIGGVSQVLTFPGELEADQQKTQQVTPLVQGRVENVYAKLGDDVSDGSVLATINSPQIAELHGKLHEAETRLMLARENLQRVEKTASKAAIIKAKADLDLAEANQQRISILFSKGISPQKDLIAAEAELRRAQAEYDFQSNVNYNREVATAKAEVKMAATESKHIEDQLRSLGVILDTHTEHTGPIGPHDTSLVKIQAPMSGTVIDRLVNVGAGTEPGKPIFTVADTSTLWAVAGVPETEIAKIKLGIPATVTPAALGAHQIKGTVTYIDPTLNIDTRSVRVRVDIPNTDRLLKVGMFVQMSFQVPPPLPESNVLIPDQAVQQIGNRTVVFIPKNLSAGQFVIRDVQVGSVTQGQVPVFRGLAQGEQVVTKGSFILKAKLLKEQLGEE